MHWLIAKSFFGLPRWVFAVALPFLVFVLLIGAIIWKVDHMLDQARADGEASVQAKWDSEKAGAYKARAELTSALAEAFNGLDTTLQNTIKVVSYKGQDITVRVKKDMANDPRYTSPDCALSDSVRQNVNAARSLSGATPSTPIREGTVPSSGAAIRLEFGDAGTSGH